MLSTPSQLPNRNALDHSGDGRIDGRMVKNSKPAVEKHENAAAQLRKTDLKSDEFFDHTTSMGTDQASF
jgi:hypothetical protein